MSQLLNTIRQIATVMQQCFPLKPGLLYVNPALVALTKNVVQIRSVLVKCPDAPSGSKLRLIVVPVGQTLEYRMTDKVKRDQAIAKFPERLAAYEKARVEFDAKKAAGELTANQLAKPPVRPTEPTPLRIDVVVGGIELNPVTDDDEPKAEFNVLPLSCIAGAPAFSPGDALYAVIEGLSAGSPAVEAVAAIKDDKGKVVKPAVAAKPAVPAGVVSGVIALDFIPSV